MAPTSHHGHAGAVPIRFTEPPGPEDIVNHEPLDVALTSYLAARTARAKRFK